MLQWQQHKKQMSLSSRYEQIKTRIAQSGLLTVRLLSPAMSSVRGARIVAAARASRRLYLAWGVSKAAAWKEYVFQIRAASIARQTLNALWSGFVTLVAGSVPTPVVEGRTTLTCSLLHS